MTTKVLDVVRQPPLLRGPAEDEEWWRMGGGDERGILDRLEDCRKRRWGRGLAPIIYHARELGLRVEVTDSDVKAMIDGLNEERKALSGGWIAEQHYYLRRLGHPQRITPLDEERMTYTLNGVRQGENVVGDDLARVLEWTMGIGFNVRLTARDKKGLAASLNRYRGAGFAYPVLTILHFMHRHNFGEKPNEDDYGMIREEFKRQRTQREWFGVASMLAKLKDFPPPEEDPSQRPPIPPLKEYVQR